MNDCIFELNGLKKSYESFALDNVSIALPKGCIMGFIGENGSGKSTTIKLMLNLIKRDSGEIKIFGLDNIRDEKEIKQNIGVVFDESCFPENLKLCQVDTILKNIYRMWDSKTFFSYAKKFEIPSDKIIREYSRGMKMKLSIAAALSHNAKLLILDEATSGLDPVVRDEILDVFLDFIQNEEHSIFLASHITSDLEKICDYITFIHKGKIIFSEQKDMLTEKYGILRCSNPQLDEMKSAVIGSRKNFFGAEALVDREKLPAGTVCEKATIEDIMLFHIKGKRETGRE